MTTRREIASRLTNAHRKGQKAAYLKHRYRHDDAFRQVVLRRSKAYTDRCIANPIYHDLKLVRSKVSRARDAVTNALKRLEKREVKLIEAVRERDQLQAQWNKIKHLYRAKRG